MNKWMIILLVIIGLMLIAVPFVSAGSDPVGGCPDDFQLHVIGDLDHEHEGKHKHVGNDQDFNDDGWICGKHAGANGNVHVHIDNVAALPVP